MIYLLLFEIKRIETKKRRGFSYDGSLPKVPQWLELGHPNPGDLILHQVSHLGTEGKDLSYPRLLSWAIIRELDQKQSCSDPTS